MAILAYLGPEGTFTHQAALDLAHPEDELRPAATAIDVVRADASAEADAGVVALENSLEGSVAANLDEMMGSTGFVLAGERILRVSFALLRAPGDSAPLTEVTSHPFALGQCSGFIRERGLAVREAPSTAAACRDLAARPEPGLGALANAGAAAVYGLRVEAEGLEDPGAPTTR